jgi:thymidine kinase
MLARTGGKDNGMAKLYFKYGAMGSSKTANALITKFNYEERGMRVWLIKPALDDRNGVGKVYSRIGIEADAFVVSAETDLIAEFASRHQTHAIIADECQFFTSAQIDQLRYIVDEYDVPVLCFGLRTDFLTHMFDGSRRLFEVADSITEVKTICACGKKAIVNAPIDGEGHVLTEGGQILIGGNDAYVAMCHKCWKRAAGK